MIVCGWALLTACTGFATGFASLIVLRATCSVLPKQGYIPQRQRPFTYGWALGACFGIGVA